MAQQAGRRGADRRRDLIDAAYQRLARDGFEGLRTRDVAADAGVNIATLHYYFPTKEALIRGVIGYVMQRFTETMPEHGAPDEQIVRHLRRLARLLRTEPELWAVMGELVLRAPRDANLERIFRETDAYWHRSLRGLLSAAIDQGLIDPPLDADGMAMLMIAAIKGVSLPTVSGFSPDIANQLFQHFERLLGLWNSEG